MRRQKLSQKLHKFCDHLRTLRQKAAVVRLWPTKLSQTSSSFICLESKTAEGPTHYQILSATVQHIHSLPNSLPASN